jgi:Xaa-Pro dipeptidase
LNDVDTGRLLDRDLDGLYLEHVADLEARYARAVLAHAWDGAVIHSGSRAKRSAFDDQYWPLRPVPHWQHWVPLTEPDCALIVRPGKKTQLVIVQAQNFWEKPAPPVTRAYLDVFDVVTVDDPGKVKGYTGGGHIAFVGEDLARGASWGVPDGGLCPAPLLGALDQLRVTKTPYEIACIAEANHRARAGHEALRTAFREADASELALHLLYLGATSQDDWETPYKNIVALGANAATLHHVSYGVSSKVRGPDGHGAESLLVDAGATCRGYCADITRTWVKGSGVSASVFAHLIAGIEAMQQRLCGAIRVGMPYEDLHDESHRQAAEVLRDAGIVRGSMEEAVATGVTRAFYPHGLGHSLGLQTHDVGCGLRQVRPGNGFLRNTTDIATGQVFTIEPGLYFIDELLDPFRAGRHRALVDWKAVEALAPLGGIRIEDDVHVVAGDSIIRNLTREHLPEGGGQA